MTFSADKAGGLATPNISIGGLSRSHGPVGGSEDNVSNFAAGTFTPADFFGGGAKILGGIALEDILVDTFAEKNIPKLSSVPVYPGGDTKKPPTKIESRLAWKPEVKSMPPFEKTGNTVFELNAVAVTDLGDGSSETNVHGQLEHFNMNLFGFVVLTFVSMTFDVVPGKKPDFSAVIDDEVVFGGPLEFVNEFKDYLGGDGFSDPPSLSVTPEGVKLGFSLELPSIAVGVMTLQNVAVGAGLSLPFNGDPVRLRFAFCERERPFILTIYCFGGGGFFAVELGLHGVSECEASLEFGASISIDVGVASGGVHVMAGIYYCWQEAEQRAWLEGYVRMGGELDVLGIVSLSLEFIMKLAYETDSGKVWGEATLIVEIEVAFFSDSVEVSVRREFGDPDRLLFDELITSGDWAEYWGAFAEAA